jgi:6-phosphogluconolactonase
METTRDLLVQRVANDFVNVVVESLEANGRADVVLTGGSVGIDVLKAVRDQPRAAEIDWNSVRVWWGDERFVEAGHSERNDAQARAALLDSIPLNPDNVHPFPAAQGQTLEQALADFADEFDLEFSGKPRFDVVLNGIGPDGHIASLFPGRDHGRAADFVVAISDSPKPPPARLSLTFAALNAGEHVWIVAAGSDKAEAIANVMSGEDSAAVPATLLRGTRETCVYVDSLAGATLI